MSTATAAPLRRETKTPVRRKWFVYCYRRRRVHRMAANVVAARAVRRRVCGGMVRG
jgi:hypothetical protein